MPNRNLRTVKLTPIALGICEACKAEFQSKQPIESDAEAEITFQFNDHKCEPRVAIQNPAPVFLAGHSEK